MHLIPRANMEAPTETARAEWPLLAALSTREAVWGERAAAQGAVAAGCYEFLRFGIKQGWACLFGGLLLAIIIGTRLWYPHHDVIAR